jgi:acetylornithine deacetylase/succinyl-diaminopimelate desuccinylase-like protein
VLRAGSSHNVIPGEGRVNLDIRTLPGVDDAAVDELLVALLGPQTDHVQITHLLGWPSSASPTDTPLYESVVRAVAEVGGAPVVPIIAAGGSDARHFRALGIPSYGFGLLSSEMTYEEYRRRIHGHDERIDLESVALSLAALRLIVQQRIGP